MLPIKLRKSVFFFFKSSKMFQISQENIETQVNHCAACLASPLKNLTSTNFIAGLLDAPREGRFPHLADFRDVFLDDGRSERN